jgi:hypothetical protein
MAAHSSRTAVDHDDRIEQASGSVFESHEPGPSELQLSASETSPAAGGFVGRIVYNASYAVSFGVTFPVMMVVRVMPKDNAFVHGLVDGALAAHDRVYDGNGEIEADHHEDEHQEDGAHATENGHAHHGEAAAHATHSRPKAKRSSTRKTTRSSPRKKG